MCEFFVLKGNNCWTCHEGIYVPEDLKYIIKPLIPPCFSNTSSLFYFRSGKLGSVILFFLVVDRFIKSNEYLIEATELPLSRG